MHGRYSKARPYTVQIYSSIRGQTRGLQVSRPPGKPEILPNRVKPVDLCGDHYTPFERSPMRCAHGVLYVDSCAPVRAGASDRIRYNSRIRNANGARTCPGTRQVFSIPCQRCKGKTNSCRFAMWKYKRNPRYNCSRTARACNFFFFCSGGHRECPLPHSAIMSLFLSALFAGMVIRALL